MDIFKIKGSKWTFRLRYNTKKDIKPYIYNNEKILYFFF